MPVDLQAGDLFFLGRLCNTSTHAESEKGYLHLVREGRGLLQIPDAPPIRIEEPTLIFMSGHMQHTMTPLDAGGLDVFCISFDFGSGVRNPLTHTLKRPVLLQLNSNPDLMAVANRIFSETAERHCGYQMAVHHLSAYFTIQAVRCSLRLRHLDTGLLRGLADRQIGQALSHMHQDPAAPWQLETLAERAHMSRTRFALRFKETVGVSPMDYLATWRISLAQSLLLQGVPVALVAERTGYSHNAALTRAFTRIVGHTPTAWLAQQREQMKAAEEAMDAEAAGQAMIAEQAISAERAAAGSGCRKARAIPAPAMHGPAAGPAPFPARISASGRPAIAHSVAPATCRPARPISSGRHRSPRSQRHRCRRTPGRVLMTDGVAVTVGGTCGAGMGWWRGMARRTASRLGNSATVR